MSGTATEDEVRLRAAQWDQEPSEYVALAERYLGFQQPGSVYGFSDAGNGDKRVCAYSVSYPSLLLFFSPLVDTDEVIEYFMRYCSLYRY